MKHYFVCAALMGCAVAYGCMALLGPSVGGALAVLLAVWHVKSTYDMERDDAARDEVARAGEGKK